MNNVISYSDIKSQLRKVVTPDDEVVVIFSGIWMFGSLLGKTVREVPDYLISTILESLGPERTVIFPSYTYGYGSTRKFDLITSKPETGVLPARALLRPEFVRTSSPLNSYLISGPRTQEALGITDTSLWGDESVMGWFDKVSARICVLGEPWHQACTHYHRAEDILQVPYRYYKKFPGSISKNGIYFSDCAPTMFVRPMGCEMVRDYTGPAKIMKQRNMILSGDNPSFPIESALAPNIVKACTDLLSDDIYAYVSNKNQLMEWVGRAMNEEVSKLSDGERVV